MTKCLFRCLLPYLSDSGKYVLINEVALERIYAKRCRKRKDGPLWPTLLTLYLPLERYCVSNTFRELDLSPSVQYCLRLPVSSFRSARFSIHPSLFQIKM